MIIEYAHNTRKDRGPNIIFKWKPCIINYAPMLGINSFIDRQVIFGPRDEMLIPGVPSTEYFTK